MSNRNPTDMGGAFAGVPMCSRERCPSYDGKRCRETGNEPESVCVPEVRRDNALLVDATRILVMMAEGGVGITVRHFCSMCSADFADEDDVRAHQAECVEHPAVKARETLRADRDDLARRADVLRNETTKLRRLLEEALDYAEDAAAEQCDRREVTDAAKRIRKEAGL